ncbi:MAG TPA: hypothetical protein DCP71_01365 [Verrucomicrobiales bacterium]|nr:hypothetical protein [Verrucomicrobiales bacterium]
MKFLVSLLLFSAVSASAQSVLETVDEALTVATPNQMFRADLSGLIDLELYAPDTPAMGLLNTDDDLFFNPRLTLFLDLQATEHLRGHVQMRVDRGFDPGFAPDGQTRLDEYFLEWKPLEKSWINFRLGKFATAFGAWTQRRLSWDNPFITAPMAYSDMLPVTDDGAVPFAAFQNRRNLPDNRQTWQPIIWGPSYATGASVFGQIGLFDYAFEAKNAALASAPRSWDGVENGWDATTYTGRIGWRPAPEWDMGVSYSRGAYLVDARSPRQRVMVVPGGNPFTKREDYYQTTYGVDASWTHGPWQVWGELMNSRFEVPNLGGNHLVPPFLEANAGTVRVVSGFVEVKRKLGPQWWVATRWNQSWFGDLPGTDTAWDNDGWRADVSVGYRFSRHLQAKLQYSMAGRQGAGREGHHLVAGQITLKF